MKVLVIGSGGREHAIVRKIARDRSVPKKSLQGETVNAALTLYAAPGNPGIAEYATCVPLAVDDVDGITAWVVQNAIDFTIVGPEVPLALGLADRLRALGRRVFGPGQAGAQLESSKAYAKGIMERAGIPTPRYHVVTSYEEGMAVLAREGAPIVVKADGLAAGKGVTVAQTEEEAERALHAAFLERAFGDAGGTVVLEQFLVGVEVSALAFVDESGFRAMPLIQDHKAVNDGDRGPNTGGMGTVSPVAIASDALSATIEKEIFAKIHKQLAAEGISYQGVLFAGLMVVAQTPYVIEFNARFGDPETQVALELLQDDLLTVMEAVTENRVAEHPLGFASDAVVCVVATAQGYPGAYRKGDLIEGLADMEAAGAYVLHAGTALADDGSVRTNGGRVLNVVGRGLTLLDARAIAYGGMERVSFSGKHVRTDLGLRR
ncbi:phosphoribosylamine--glycine ligase [Ferroacidibacillus organovorans]|uniref:Phosphoribosylamine--glycine ligase n=1 Tax=Ferroacidibacillus organovorans TaxID=1765683 RepID=A0A101XQ66_9BACL|nr:phosphoribosylamine--glycine ligase [Ferroacidibacillus organovorans]KUO95424.1 hypothetical protein ATW55_02875 [Ferroacidibacillus organovorans]